MTVVAPDTNQSAVGHQKTLMRPLRVRERTLADGSMGYSIDGSPTDAVSLAFLGFFEERFDLVASGINYGANLGDDITYSGTVSAAMEAVINNCPAFAISQEYYEQVDFALASLAAAVVARNILEHGLKRGELLSVNVPAVSIDGLRGLRGHPGRPTRLPGPARRSASTRAGIPYYWLGGPPPSGISVPARTSTRWSTGGCRSRRSTSTSPAAACSASSRRGTGRSRTRRQARRAARGRRVPPPSGGADAAEEARIAEESQLERR